MKVIEFKFDKVTKTVSVKYQLSGSEADTFELVRNKTIADIAQEISTSYDNDQVIRATFRALDFPIEMYDKVADAKASGKARKLVDVRSACMYQLRKHTTLSLSAIGRIFDVTHATVIHNIKRFQDQLDLHKEDIELLDREVEYILTDMVTSD